MNPKKLSPAQLRAIAQAAVNPQRAAEEAADKALKRFERTQIIRANTPAYAPLTTLVLYANAPKTFVRKLSTPMETLQGRGMTMPNHSVGIFQGVSPYRLAAVLYQQPRAAYVDTHTFEIIPYAYRDERTILLDYDNPLYRTYYKGHAANDPADGTLGSWIVEKLFTEIKNRLEY